MPINFSTSTAVFWWRPAAWLRVWGTDAATFLQGQLTNDLRVLEQNAAVYGLWLTVKGKVLADSFVLRGAHSDEFWVGSYFSPARVIRDRLESHVIADDVVIEDLTADWAAVSVVGADAVPLLEARPVTGFAFHGRRTRAANVELVFPQGSAEAVRRELAGNRQLGDDEIGRMRIAAAIPAIPADVGPEDLPNEAALEGDAISYTKGCYLGQEVMARLKSMGHVRRRLLRVSGDGETIPSLPARIFAGARDVGALRSATRDGEGGWIGLAMLSLLHVSSGAELALAGDAAPVLRIVDTI